MENTIKNMSYYDKAVLDCFIKPTMLVPKVIGYKKVKVPVYFEINVPVLEKHYNYSDYGEFDEYEGLLLTTKKVKLFKIGTRIEKEPIYETRKSKGLIKFSRYSPIKQKKVIKKQIDKLKNGK